MTRYAITLAITLAIVAILAIVSKVQEKHRKTEKIMGVR